MDMRPRAPLKYRGKDLPRSLQGIICWEHSGMFFGPRKAGARNLNSSLEGCRLHDCSLLTHESEHSSDKSQRCEGLKGSFNNYTLFH